MGDPEALVLNEERKTVHFNCTGDPEAPVLNKK